MKDMVSVRYLVDDVAASVDFHTKHLGFEVNITFPAFADVPVRRPRRFICRGTSDHAIRTSPRPDP